MYLLNQFKSVIHIIIIIALIPSELFSQNTFEGKIEYAISYEELPAEVAAMESMLPKEMVFHIKGNKIALVQDMMGGKQTVVSDSETNESFIMMNMMGQKIAITMTSEEVEEAAEELNDAEVKYFSETKEIAGYKCHKATVTNEGNTVEVWYTKDIIGAMHSEFKSLDGFPLEYFSFQEGMKMKISAASVTKGAQPDNLFIIPDDYKKMTMQEFSGAIGMGGNY